MIEGVVAEMASDIFAYNRENYMFDNESRLKRDLNRLNMQIARFNLFREDIEDLVRLTVDKMDMYHLVGALFLSFTAVIYTEGRITGCVVPPFFIGIYFMSITGAFVYLLLTVWLSMHASITSHSIGVRLRTRYVRLPIPTLAQLQKMAAQLAAFERAGVRNIARIPFVGGGQSWNDGAGSGNSAHGTSPELLHEGEQGFNSAERFDKEATELGRHIKFFRSLQGKWQCFDAYSRVCMTLGVNQMTQSLSFYLIGTMLIARNSISTTCTLVFAFQATAFVLMLIDVSGIEVWRVFVMQLIGSMPAGITIFALHMAERERTALLKTDNDYHIGIAAFFCQLIWFELLLWTVRPSSDKAALPRKFRSVLYLDVFGDATYQPTQHRADSVLKSLKVERAVGHAVLCLDNAFKLWRRWEAVPEQHLTAQQLAELRRMRQDILTYRHMLKSYIESHLDDDGFPDTAVDELVELRSWSQLSQAEKLEDSYANQLVGLVETDRLYDVEKDELVDLREGMDHWLKLEDAAAQIHQAKAAVEAVVREESAQARATSDAASEASDTDSEEETPDGTKQGNREDSYDRASKLPWRAVCSMTRAIQLCWFGMGVCVTLEDVFPQWFTIDWTVEAEERRRRLLDFSPISMTPNDAPQQLSAEHAKSALSVTALDVDWPFGQYFRPVSLSCLPSNDNSTKDELLVGTASLLYTAQLITAANLAYADAAAISKIKLHPVLPRTDFVAGAVALCAGTTEGEPFGRPGGNSQVSLASKRCMWGELLAEENKLALWSFGSPRGGAVQVQIRATRPWLHFAGAVLRCRDVPDLLPPISAQQSIHDAGWCLVLAGWDGQSVPIATLRLPDWPSAIPQSVQGEISAVADAPLSPKLWGTSQTRNTLDLHTLHLGARSGRLLAVVGHRNLQAWDLLGLRSLGSWPVQLAGNSALEIAGGKLRLLAACDLTGSGSLLFLAIYDFAGPSLLQLANSTFASLYDADHSSRLQRATNAPYG